MPNLDFIFKTEKKKLLEKLSYYGIKELPYLLISSGKEKVRGYTGNLSNEEILNIEKAIGIQIIGLYLFHNYFSDENEGGLRLSFDAISSSELKNQITKNVLDLNDKQAEEFLKGRDILLTNEEIKALEQKHETKGFKILRNQNEFIGTGKLVEGRIVNYMPKERRLR
jgi:NOL1/NOP2/fmu family ribosome biogenesis protein